MPVRVDQSQNCDSISDANMAYDEYANRHIADIDSLKECIYVTACPMSEVLYNNLAEIETSGIHKCIGVEKDKYILLSALYLIVAHCLKGTSSLYHRVIRSRLCAFTLKQNDQRLWTSAISLLAVLIGKRN